MRLCLELVTDAAEGACRASAALADGTERSGGPWALFPLFGRKGTQSDWSATQLYSSFPSHNSISSSELHHIYQLEAKSLSNGAYNHTESVLAILIPHSAPAFSKIIPHQAHPRQSFTPEPVSLTLFAGLILFLMLFGCRPIPQWFRLKTDTKIQVRDLVSFCQREHISEAVICSIMPNAVIGDARN